MCICVHVYVYTCVSVYAYVQRPTPVLFFTYCSTLLQTPSHWPVSASQIIGVRHHAYTGIHGSELHPQGLVLAELPPHPTIVMKSSLYSYVVTFLISSDLF